ncbi:MAG: bifunctional diaminohydroxyphosphoribosylaminopyrimidine deaminase/5-amino-6-(5-phosphoribosylamino)uracil reductase RibD [Mariniphaga sp.]|nr:bifunctional diaminohydroxyphosphoribosylaminopyrimidine deaminase/5-amino-6-(5-phosphoribosylamino)uracil reductase RibD [Mariniphaga sp.]
MIMITHEKYMQRCIELARLGVGFVSPNPMVGCVIVHKGKIIGEGYHQKCGDAHAEVNAINSVKNQNLLTESTLFVSLEPCAHQGKTPPCTDLIIRKKIQNVVIGTIDPFSEVAGKGIEKFKNAGIDISLGIFESECRELNKRFFTYYEKKRPYVILKWAQTLDGFIDFNRDENQHGEPTWISGELARRLVHKIRSEEDAILVGTNTAEKDNPSLTVYNWTGRNPSRILIDKSLRLPQNLKLFDNTSHTYIFNSIKSLTKKNTHYFKIDFTQDIIPQILQEFKQLEIQSVIVEGGKQLLQSFIDSNLWDEAHVYMGNQLFQNGITAPNIKGKLVFEDRLDSDWIKVLYNHGK